MQDLAVILDLRSRRIIGWAVSNRMKRDLAIRALKMAIALRSPPKGCVHHTDRGSQGGFKWSSQRFGLYLILGFHLVLRLAISTREFCGVDCLMCMPLRPVHPGRAG